jgi:hypothetical protein
LATSSETLLLETGENVGALPFHSSHLHQNVLALSK